MTKVAKQELGENAWHRVEVFWDAQKQSLSYSIDGAFAGKLTGDVLDAYLGGRTQATFGFVGARLADGTECHEVRLVGTGPTRLPASSAAAAVPTISTAAPATLALRLQGLTCCAAEPATTTCIPVVAGTGCSAAAAPITSSSTPRAKPAAATGRHDHRFRDRRDVIDLSGIDADRKTPAIRPSTGSVISRSTAAAALRGRGAVRRVYGDRKPDFFIRLEGVHALATS